MMKVSAETHGIRKTVVSHCEFAMAFRTGK
jgi:hypothetical protein